MPAQKSGRIQIYLPPQNLRQLFFHLKELPPRNVTGFKFYQYIYITIGSKIVMENGTKKRKPLNMIPTAELSNFLSVYGNFNAHGLLLSLSSAKRTTFNHVIHFPFKNEFNYALTRLQMLGL